MFTETGHGVPNEVWDRRNTPLRGLPHGGEVPNLISDHNHREARRAAVAHAHSAFPRECCGAFVRAAQGLCGGVEYVPLTNVHDEPTKSYQVNPQELTVKLAGRQLVGMHHSHPKGNTHTGEGFCPSEADMECQISWQVPFYVTVLGRANVYRDFFGWGDQLHVPPFRGREFRHGVTDCFALVRQVMGLVYGKTPPDFPRSMNWWDDPDADNPILAYFDQSGFEDIRFEDIQPGDGLIYTLGRGIPAHCAVYIGNDLLMHHLSGRLSKIDPVPTWRRQFYKAVRYAPGADTQPGERISGDRRKTEEGGTSRPLG